MNRQELCEDTLVLHISDSVKGMMDERMIRVADVKKVIAHAENTGEMIMDAASGRLIAHLVIGNITCWAEYSERGGGYELHNAYFHRIRVEE